MSVMVKVSEKRDASPIVVVGGGAKGGVGGCEGLREGGLKVVERTKN